MLRKHWESYLIMLKQTCWYDICVIQVHNAFWEELAKLIIIGISCCIFRINSQSNRKKRIISLGYGIGLSYGMGEAFLLIFLMLYPVYSHYFGLNTFGTILTKSFIYERFWAIQTHAIMGGVIGIGVYRYLFHRKRKDILIFFLVAMLYHISIDGSIVFIYYYPELMKHYPPPLLFMPLLTLIGYGILYIIGKRSLEVYKATA